VGKKKEQILLIKEKEKEQKTQTQTHTHTDTQGKTIFNPVSILSLCNTGLVKTSFN
jgi:hypothetical protein